MASMRVAVVFAILVGCADARLQYVEYLEANRVANCKRLVRCGVALDVQTCLRAYPPLQIDPDRLGALDAGKIEFDAGVASACLAEVESLTCDRTSREYRQPLCTGLLRGTLGDQEPCAFGSECISQECWVESELACDDAGCCRGTCVGELAPQVETVGGRCRFEPCFDAWCDGSACVALLPEGAACNVDGDRWWREVCEYGLECFYGTCTRAVGSGESSLSNPCRLVGDIRGAGGTCVRRRIAGERCYGSVEPECVIGLVCDRGTKTCVDRDAIAPVERVPVGAPCRYVLGPWCEEGAFCDVADPEQSLDGICTLPKPVGASCRSDSQCASDSCNRLGVCIAEACF